MEFTGSAKIACAKGLFAGETGLVGFCVVWTREELGFISLEGFLLSLGFDARHTVSDSEALIHLAYVQHMWQSKLVVILEGLTRWRIELC